ncbi:glycosyltransferase family 39 protein [Natrinema caseinilyticum]|uniref:glycosyltransferase family 39 protein n=1 Tax=Natrinema caseinilyticum TaxID=2961570 RepID=UPI0020C32CB3|nr:glycosyltransferase family 39 protein [Natrinema caseinilyticum]
MIHRTEQTADVVVTTARLLVTFYLAAIVLAGTGTVGFDGVLDLRLLFWPTLVIGTIGVITRYRLLAWAARAYDRARLTRWRRSWDRSGVARILSLLTRNLALALAVLAVGALAGSRVPFYVDLDLLSWLVIATLAVTLVVRQDRTAAITARVGSLVLVCSALLASVFDPVRSALGVKFYVLTGLFAAVTVWKARDRISGRDRGSVWSTRRGGRIPRLGGWRSSRIGLAVLLVLAVAVYFYRLGALHLFGDEYQVVSAAAGYYHTGEFYSWNWIAERPTDTLYDRAWPHTVMIAVSYAVFGTSEWASRLPSAMAGVVFVPLSYAVFTYFTERRWVGLFSTGALLLYPATIDLFRWARMYAILIPLSLLLTYLVYRSLTEGNTVDFHDERINAFVDTWFDFNLKIGALTLLVLYFAFHVHVNSLFVLAGAYLFVLYRLVTTDERKYATASIVGAGGLIAVTAIVRFTDRLEFLSNFLSFFGRDNTVYVEYLLQFPVEVSLGVVLYVIGFVGVHLLGDPAVRAKLTYLYLLSTFSLVFLVYVGDRYASFAYIVHVVPIAVVLVVFGFVTFVSAFDSRAIRTLLIGLLAVTVLVPFAPVVGESTARDLYVDDAQDFTTAYGTIEENYEPEDEAVFGQYLRSYYLKDLDRDATIVSMEHNQAYTPAEFHRDLSAYESGWITWETRKSYHVHPEIREYVDENFEHYHGDGVDETGVEVYYFNESMIEGDRAA